jgi:plastocyanin
MAKSTINTGTAANDGTGDNLRSGATKINSNTDELYNALGDGTNLKDLINSSLEIDVPNDDSKVNKIALHVGTTNGLNQINPSTYHGALLHNHQTGTVHVAHAGAWHKLLMDASGGDITNYTDPLASVAYIGNINSLTDVDTVSQPPQTGNVLKWDGAKWAPGTDVSTGGGGTDADTLDGFDSAYFTNYNNLNNKPTIPTALTDLNISDGTDGQVLTTDGSGGFTFTTVSSGSVQNLFETVGADTGSTVANSATDTLTIQGGTNIATSIIGDTLTIAYVGSPNSGEANQNAFSNVQADTGLAEADSTTDTLTIAGGTNITTSVTGDTVTIDYSGTNGFNDLTDVTLSSPANGAVVIYNGTGWVNAPQTIDRMAYPAITTLVVTADSSNGYKFDQYGNTEDPTIYALNGATIAFDLNDSSLGNHPFQIETGGGSAYDIGLVHVATDGTVSTASNAQGKTSGTLYWKIPANISGNYAYQCTVHSAMRGTITIKQMSAI